MKTLRDLKTEEDVRSLEIGRELDLCIAELITGQDRLMCRVDPMNRNGEPQFYWGYPLQHDFAPEYSTDSMSYPCMKIIELFKEKGCQIQINSPGFYSNGTSYQTFDSWYCLIQRGANETAALFDVWGECDYGMNLMDAICRAALLAHIMMIDLAEIENESK